MGKAKKTKSKKRTIKRLNLPDDEPLHIPLSFEDAVKLALNTPIKGSKIYKK